ncbi:MAG: hypothetical protein GEV28_16150 [Actinophytocola sp.]|uniref:hypothetical protein n=1 Tax=Actinophytocola sp. TaxID=1872138 RepID=UPI0013211730|nr:hypothetical protein [Actinophytocola sp.]MPZ81842.1 hypothetical protein [Actinophytocola sp.]
MGEFVDAALSFPAVLLSFLLVVVVLYWLLVVLGTLDIDVGGGDDVGGDDGGGDDGDGGGLLDGLGLGGVPVTVSLSVLIIFAWFVSLVGGLLLVGLDGALATALGIGVLVVAIVVGLLAARLIALPLRKLYVSGLEPSRADFIGRECVVRTGKVSTDFGQAEVTAADGSSAVIQVRQTGEHELTAGRLALIFDYDTDGEFFWVAPAAT